MSSDVLGSTVTFSSLAVSIHSFSRDRCPKTCPSWFCKELFRSTCFLACFLLVNTWIFRFLCGFSITVRVHCHLSWWFPVPSGSCPFSRSFSAGWDVWERLLFILQYLVFESVVFATDINVCGILDVFCPLFLAVFSVITLCKQCDLTRNELHLVCFLCLWANHCPFVGEFLWGRLLSASFLTQHSGVCFFVELISYQNVTLTHQLKLECCARGTSVI